VDVDAGLFLMLDTLYPLVGAICGISAGAVMALGELCGAQRRKLETRVWRSLTESLADAETAAHRLAAAGYFAAGTTAGLYAGAKYGAASLWLYWVEDEVKIRILEGSPMKYRFHDLEHLCRTSPMRGHGAAASPASTPRRAGTLGVETPPGLP
jgi:hypothetical protein